jgi:hypothetical protein
MSFNELLKTRRKNERKRNKHRLEYAVALWKQLFMSILSSKSVYQMGDMTAEQGSEELLESHVQSTYPLLLGRGKWFY